MAAKSKPAFTPLEEFYIAGHLNHDPAEVAKALGKPRAIKKVTARMEELRAALPRKSNLVTEATNGRKGVVAMTGAAANSPPQVESQQEYLERAKDFIFNPNGG